MKRRRYLLVTAALSTVACGKTGAKVDDREVAPLPANPKGSYYDSGLDQPPPPPPDPIPPPANPKGSHYDAGLPKK